MCVCEREHSAKGDTAIGEERGSLAERGLEGESQIDRESTCLKET